MKKNATLIFIPTYNERENVEPMCRKIFSLGLEADLLAADDNSPDGTGEILDRLAQTHPNLFVIHRPAKLGVGSAHAAGIEWAYDRGYETLVTLDADFTHSPEDIPRLLEPSRDHHVVLGSRFLHPDGLSDWNPYRKFLTRLGHFLTRKLLGIKHDATGAFRVYRLCRIPRGLFARVKSPGYAFFFESLFWLQQNGCSVCEIPIILPARTYGHSKMSVRDIVCSVWRLIWLWCGRLAGRKGDQIQLP